MSDKRITEVSSAVSSGGGGNLFEQHTNAYLLAMLLVGANVPFLKGYRVDEVTFQTEILGFNTDDFLLKCGNDSGDVVNVLGQVKRKITVSSSDKDCTKAVGDFWKDFKRANPFVVDRDIFVLVTLRATETLLKGLVTLVSCARASRDVEEFGLRLKKKGHLSATAVSHFRAICEVVNELEKRELQIEEVWPFLRHIYVLPLDLANDTHTTESNIKSILSVCRIDDPQSMQVEAAWEALVVEVGLSMPEAKTYRREHLSKLLIESFVASESQHERLLASIDEHSQPIADFVKTQIAGSISVDRESKAQEVINALEKVGVVIVTGAAGNGKSAVALRVLQILSKENFTFILRASELAHPHLDTTLLKAQIPCTMKRLSACLATQAGKVLLIESLERLLEASERAAFFDLLQIIKIDPNWKIIASCRSYSLEQIKTSFFDRASLPYDVVTVPSFTDDELKLVSDSLPNLRLPLSNSKLRELLRTPYYLDKAAFMHWKSEEELPETERAFRLKFWRDIVRDDAKRGGGLPQRREDAFIDIALRRAEALSMYVPRGNLDNEAIESLESSSLIEYSPNSHSLLAPSHDVLEDWALLHWINVQFETTERSFVKLAQRLGTFPALRRSYRKWLSEILESCKQSISKVLVDALTDPSFPKFAADDTLVALLKLKGINEIIAGHEEAIFGDNPGHVIRLIHLVRMSCVKSPDWLKRHPASYNSMFAIPDGEAWAGLLALLAKNKQGLSYISPVLLLAFLEDWARGVSFDTPYPDGANEAAVVVRYLIGLFHDDYKQESLLKRVLTVLVKIPNSSPKFFIKLLQSPTKKLKHASSEMVELILTGMDGNPTARDLPDLIISLIKSEVLISKVDEDGFGYHRFDELDTLFGVEGSPLRWHPPSAFQGPFFTLLRKHPRKGLDFIKEVLNHSGDCYGLQKYCQEEQELTNSITLSFPDGSTQTQWANSRLWNLHRGSSVGPHILKCMLMALERWLLDLSKRIPNKIDEVLLQLLRDGNSTLITAVVAGVATSRPHSAPETLLTLLSSMECILLDRNRKFSEHQATSQLLKIVPQLNASHKIYDDERIKSDSLPHRSKDLEGAILELQSGNHSERVQTLLDEHLKVLSRSPSHGEEEKILQLCLYRMDRRKYATYHIPAAQESESSGHEQDATSYGVVLKPTPVPESLREMVNNAAMEFQSMQANIGLYTWGISVFRREESATFRADDWRERLALARSFNEPTHAFERIVAGEGVGIVAAICVRDHWDELVNDERDWCLGRIKAEIVRDCQRWSDLHRAQNGRESGKYCARTIATCLKRSLSEAWRSELLALLPIALTHPDMAVRQCTAWGIAQNLWESDPEIAWKCVNAVCLYGTEVDRRLEEADVVATSRRGAYIQIEIEVAEYIRQVFNTTSEGVPSNALENLDKSTFAGADAFWIALTILSGNIRDGRSIDALCQASEMLSTWWDAGRNRRAQRKKDVSEAAETGIEYLLESIILDIPENDLRKVLTPMLNAIEKHTREVAWFIKGLVAQERQKRKTKTFWQIWKLFADRMKSARWFADLDEKHARGQEVVSAIFLGHGWDERERHWQSLENGSAENVNNLFESTPVSSYVFGEYIHFLHSIGEQELPKAFLRLSKRLEELSAQGSYISDNAQFLLESLLQRYIYTAPLALKSNTELREAVLIILDLMVDRGSSAAFRMRDDFVTPLSALDV